MWTNLDAHMYRDCLFAIDQTETNVRWEPIMLDIYEADILAEALELSKVPWRDFSS